MRILADGPFGVVLLVVTSIGLLLFAVWQVGQTFTSDATDLIGLAQRVGWFGLAISYAPQSATGFQVALATISASRPTGSTSADVGSGGPPTSPEGLTPWLFSLPGGRFAVTVVGLTTVGVAAHQLRKGARHGNLASPAPRVASILVGQPSRADRHLPGLIRPRMDMPRS